MKRQSRNLRIGALSIGMLMLTIGASAQSGANTGMKMKSEYLYTINNDSVANGIEVFARGMNGSLTRVPGSPFLTDGKGLNSSDVDDQGSIRSVGNNIIAVNPGSHTIAVLAKGMNGVLKPVAGSPFSSNGLSPISITAANGILYAANQAVGGGIPNITGFRIGMNGELKPIPNSTIPFPVGAGPAQVEFSPNGKLLFVTSGFQKPESSVVHSYRVMSDGTLTEAEGSPMHTGDSTGDVGFSWHPNGKNVYASNFRGSSIVSFRINSETGAIQSREVAPNGESAACWTAISKDGKWLYVANFVSNSISTYKVDAMGVATHVVASKRMNVMSPDTKDIVLSSDGKYLYAIGSGARKISTFEIGTNGIATEISSINVLSGSALKGLIID